jgi:hypothetical protein
MALVDEQRMAEVFVVVVVCVGHCVRFGATAMAQVMEVVMKKMEMWETDVSDVVKRNEFYPL